MAALDWVLVMMAAPARSEQPFMTVEGDLKSVAWWVLADFHPFTTEVRLLARGHTPC